MGISSLLLLLTGWNEVANTKLKAEGGHVEGSTHFPVGILAFPPETTEHLPP